MQSVEHLCSILHDFNCMTVCSHGSSALAEHLVRSAVPSSAFNRVLIGSLYVDGLPMTLRLILLPGSILHSISCQLLNPSYCNVLPYEMPRMLHAARLLTKLSEETMKLNQHGFCK